MAVAYDLVVIGATGAGLITAQKAIASGKKVALVQQQDQPLQDLQTRTLMKVLGHCAAQSPLENIAEILARVITPWDFYEPLAKLAAMGVDVIPEQGHFIWQPRPQFVTATRRLRSKHYAIATGTVWEAPPQENFLTLPDLLNLETWQNLAETIVLVGTETPFLHLAYALNQLGKKVILIGNQKLSQPNKLESQTVGAYHGTPLQKSFDTNQLFPSEDQDLIQQIQTFLEAVGIELYFGLNDSEKNQLFNQENITVIWGDRRRGLTTQLNLPPDFCHTAQMFLKVNANLQTSKSNIYGCGSVLGGYDLPELAIAEASTITQNLHSKKAQPCPYELVPYRLFEPLPFDHVGYQSHHFSGNLKTMQKTWAMETINQWQFPYDLTLKLWLDSQDKILGASVIGDRSGKLIYHCRDLIQAKKSFTNWQNVLENSGLFAEICGT